MLKMLKYQDDAGEPPVIISLQDALGCIARSSSRELLSEKSYIIAFSHGLMMNWIGGLAQ